MALRKAAFYVLTFVLVYGVLEGASWIAYAFVADEPFSFETLQARRTAQMGRKLAAPVGLDDTGRNRPRYVETEALHPYIGYVGDPSFEKFNEYGFAGPAPPLDRMANDTNTVFVVVVGGSVAEQLLATSADTLRRALQNIDAFAGREIEVYNFGLGGQKQPQQLMIINYFLSLGARFDLVINLDGFNEIVLPVEDNARLGTNPFYPRAWPFRVGEVPEQELLRAIGGLAYLEGVRFDVARFFSQAPLRHSVTANVFWDRLDAGLWKTIEQRRVALTEQVLNEPGVAQRKASFTKMGPRRRYASEEEQFRDLAAYWQRSSRLLHTVARAQGFHYFHFLQPNQHVPGSKIITEAERAVAFQDPPHRYAKVATEGYPHLIRSGQELAQAGVNFVDLTMMFRDNDEVLYRDTCCHFNRRGYALIVHEIAQAIDARLGPS